MDIKEIRMKLANMGESTERLTDDELINLLRDCNAIDDKSPKREKRSRKITSEEKLTKMLMVTILKWFTWCLIHRKTDKMLTLEKATKLTKSLEIIFEKIPNSSEMDLKIDLFKESVRKRLNKEKEDSQSEV